MLPLQPYFEIEENKQALIANFNNWQGVKYLHGGANKYGVDCAKLIFLIFKNLGVLKPDSTIKIENYSKDWYLHNNKQFLIESFESYFENLKPRLVALEIFTDRYYKMGDCLFFSYAKNGIANHVSIYAGKEKLYHCLNRDGVCYSSFGFSWKSRFIKAYRLYLDNMG
jgi:cell wall-associated NlpC family hydrolase